MKKILSMFTIASSLLSCNSADIPSGIWRATVKNETDVEIPFNFMFSDSSGVKQIYLINGDEKLKIDSIDTFDDSIHFFIPLFDCEIRARIKNNKLTGKSIKHLADHDVVMAFNAEYNIPWRFIENPKKPAANISGKWTSAFIGTDGISSTLVAEFLQDGNKATGTFLSSTGDYRFLEGVVTGNNLFLSGFTGSDAYLFTATLKSDSVLTDGKFYSGYNTFKTWSAKKDKFAMLADAYSITKLKANSQKISFNFPDLYGKKVSFPSQKYDGKITIVQFLGSWCANCMDETNYLTKFYDKYKTQGVEIIGIAYERSTDFNRSAKLLIAMKKRLKVKYEILVTGYTNDSADVLKSMPMLNNFSAFPTTLVIDQKGVVRLIHTGFNGPGTGRYYKEFTSNFETAIDRLLIEN